MGAVLAVVTGAALLLIVALQGHAVRPAHDVGASALGQLTSPRDAPAAAPPPGAVPPVRAGTVPEVVAPVAPVALRIPAIDVSADVDEVGVAPDTGEFEVPADVGRVGWYRFGPGLGAAAGSMVIAGHVDGVGQGPGAFFRLRELGPGDRVEVVDAAGRTMSFEVVARETFRKARFPLERYFARDGAPRLTLITCGGPFDEAGQRYRDNVVITAIPA